MFLSLSKPFLFFKKIRAIGLLPTMQPYEIRRLGVFNIINFFGACTGVIIPFAGLNDNSNLPPLAWVVAFSPFVISSIVLLANYYGKHKFAVLWYLLTYPFVTSLLYFANINVGIELFFILYGVLAVFFLDKLSEIILCVLYIIFSYTTILLLRKQYALDLAQVNFGFFIFNHLLSVVFIFLGLLLIKKENNDYQSSLITAAGTLESQKNAIEKQAETLQENTTILATQAMELSNLNNLKDKLFSVISHDLRTPIYGLKNLFTNIHQYDLPGNEIKLLLPDIVNDLNYTTALMENLLHWTKSQMAGSTANKQIVAADELIDGVKKLLRLQAEAKKIHLQIRANTPTYIYADKDMIDIVLRNLVSNAIKFTPENGSISISTETALAGVIIKVEDSGIGMAADAVHKIFGDTFYTTKGTAKENGTGLGLKLCKDFLAQNGSELKVQSKVGVGTTFYFSLPKG